VLAQARPRSRAAKAVHRTLLDCGHAEFVETSTAFTRAEYEEMRALVQRVSSASVSVEGELISAIDTGLLVLLGVRSGDGEEEADRLARKVLALRIFEDSEGRMNRSVVEVGGDVLCVSQFTLYGDVRRGNRPSFVDAAAPEVAELLYERVRSALGARGGRFGARMEVALVNDGPVTLLVEM
jgi:D-aminoacyl-tRNA deacylase